MGIESTVVWDSETQKKFWNDWDTRYLADGMLGVDALNRGDAVLTLLRTCTLEQPRILEVGCGNGWFSAKLAQFGSVAGVDIAEKAIEEARERVPDATFYAGDLLDVADSIGTYDVVITLETFSHVKSQSLFVKKLAELLREDGYLIMTTQNRTVNMRRSEVQKPAEGQIRRWVSMRGLRRELRPLFDIRKATTLQPSGDRGFLRYVNSRKLNKLVSIIIPAEMLKRAKERCGLGQSLVVLAQKRRQDR